MHAGGYEHIFRLSERSEPLQAGVSSARVARLKFEPFSLEIDLPNVKAMGRAGLRFETVRSPMDTGYGAEQVALFWVVATD